MSNNRLSMSKRAIRIATRLSLVAVMSVVAVSLLMAGAGATAFNAGGSDSGARHIPAQYTEQCSNGVAVHDPANNAGMVADCAALLASKDTLEGTTGNLNWSADRAISDWEGLLIFNNRVFELWLYDPSLNGAIPAELGNLTELRDLRLNSNQLAGEGPFDGSQLTGEIPTELANLANLTRLHLSGNQLTGAIPAELGNLANLEDLQIDHNQLTGAIPPELGNLANLRNLRLFSNRLTGAIPPELGNLANLEDLHLDDNQLMGAIPPELGNLANLLFLEINSNQLTGEIPARLGNLSSLHRLYLHDNQLTGAIPSELGNSPNLGLLRLDGNQLTGAIPPELGNSPNLEFLRLNGNRLTGCIPRSLRAPLGDAEIELLGLPICATSADRIAALETQIAEHVSVIAALQAQLAEHASRLAALEGASVTAPSPAPTATATATPSPTPTSVAGTSSGNACITALAGSGSVNGRWTPDCVTANSSDNQTYYARFYTFTLYAASEVTITLSSTDATPYLFLLAGEGMGGAVTRENGTANATSANITAALQPGAYTIEASTYRAETAGDFTLEMEVTR